MQINVEGKNDIVVQNIKTRNTSDMAINAKTNQTG